MSKFNFDSELFRRVICSSEKVQKVFPLAGLVRKAVETFYEEYDYYPNIAVFAPGTFTVFGDHLEYVKGNLVQAALPMGTVIVGKSRHCVKCKIITTSKDVEDAAKSVFPISLYKKNIKFFPEWVSFIRGVIHNFPCKELRGFDALIHSNVPLHKGCGSSAALQVGMFTFLEATINAKICSAERGCLCHLSEKQSRPDPNILGSWSNVTSSVGRANCFIRINCRTGDLSCFEMRDINVLFLLTYPTFKIEQDDRELVFRRKIEVLLASKLLGLRDVMDATEEDLEVLGSMEDPSKESIREILQDLDLDLSDALINEIVTDLFTNPKTPEEMADVDIINSELLPEEVYGEIGELRVGFSDDPGTLGDLEDSSKSPPVSYVQRRITEMCEGSIKMTDLPERPCEEINCLGGIEKLSVSSGVTVCGKLLRRLRHIVSENQRSLSMSDIISKLDYEEFGTKLIQSHLSLKLDFEVSCPTLDGLVQLAIDAEHVYGAKMMSGGGTLTLLHRNVAEKFINKVIETYGDKFLFYLVFPSSGARILNMGVRKTSKSLLSNPFLNLDETFLKAIENFEATYKYRPTHGSYSPGVVNLFGDLNDAYQGLILSLALNTSTVIVGAHNGTSKIRVATTCDVGDESQKTIFPIPSAGEVRPGRIKWIKDIKGVVAMFKGHVKGFDCLIQCSVPVNFGVLDKPPLVMAFYSFLEELHSEKCISIEEKAYLCMLAIHEFTAALLGIAEQLVIAKAREDYLVLVDSGCVATTLIPYEDPSVSLLLIYTDFQLRNQRALLYARLEECNKVAGMLCKKNLRCLTVKDLNVLRKQSKKKISDKTIQRAYYVVSENERVLKATEALRNCDFEALGELMVESHKSLRDDFEIVSREMDCLVTTAMEVDGVLGSKMVCSGGMNCALALVKHWAADDLIEYLQKKICDRFAFYVVNTANAGGALTLEKYLDKLPSPEFNFENLFPY